MLQKVLKFILGMFGFVGDATDEQTAENRALMKKIFDLRVSAPANYTIVYAYHMKQGLTSQKIATYVVGFSPGTETIAVVPAYPDLKESEEAFLLNKENITSVTAGIQGDTIFKLKNGEDIRFCVPAFTKEDADSCYMVPINQTEEAEKFNKFIKETF